MTVELSSPLPGNAQRQGSHTVAASRPRFYFWMAVAMAATAFIGFAPTFWIPLAQGVPERIAVAAIHGALFFGWTLFLIYQTWLAMSGNIARHRDVGMIGVSLATAMAIFGTLTAIGEAKRQVAAHYAYGAEAFMTVPMAGLILFVLFVIVAMVNVRRPEWHKRFLIAATAVILNAPIARLYIVYVMMGGHPPPFQGTVGLAGFPGGPSPAVTAFLLSDLLAESFILAGMVYDWRMRGKVHPAYWWAGGIAVAVHLLKGPFSGTALWHAIARGLISFAS